jgi:archaemetzincin
MQPIFVVPLKTNADFWHEALASGILKIFGIPIEIIQLNIDIEKRYDPFRRQYNSSNILMDILKSRPAGTLKVLGVVEVDLFIPILTFVFGEAQLEGVGAIVSTHRLNNKFYGLPDNSALLTQRLVKESIHELGHTFGLLHCGFPDCVMNSSTYVENIDQKSQELCTHCQTELQNHVTSSYWDNDSSIR